MPLVSIDIPTGATDRIKAMVIALGPQVAPEQFVGKDPATITNPEALAALQAMIRRFVLDLVKQVEAEAAATAARNAAISAVDNDGLVT